MVACVWLIRDHSVLINFLIHYSQNTDSFDSFFLRLYSYTIRMAHTAKVNRSHSFAFEIHTSNPEEMKFINKFCRKGKGNSQEIAQIVGKLQFSSDKSVHFFQHRRNSPTISNTPLDTSNFLKYQTRTRRDGESEKSKECANNDRSERKINSSERKREPSPRRISTKSHGKNSRR